MKPAHRLKKEYHITVSEKLERLIESHCSQNNVKSRSEFMRFALTSFFDGRIRDDTLQLAALKDIKAQARRLEKMNAILLCYLRKMNESSLLYHAEIDESLKQAALRSARERNDRFFDAFKRDIQEDRSFFESILHEYFTEEGGGDGAA